MSSRFSVGALDPTLKHLWAAGSFLVAKLLYYVFGGLQLNQSGPEARGGLTEAILSRPHLYRVPLPSPFLKMAVKMPRTPRLRATSASALNPRLSTDDGTDAVPSTDVKDVSDLPPGLLVINTTDSFEDFINLVDPAILDGDLTNFKSRPILPSSNATID